MLQRQQRKIQVRFVGFVYEIEIPDFLNREPISLTIASMRFDIETHRTIESV
jgi:hypothetical protein